MYKFFNEHDVTKYDAFYVAVKSFDDNYSKLYSRGSKFLF